MSNFAQSETIRIGTSLLHFCWQGFAIATVAWAAMTLARRATMRYAIACVAMLAMAVAPIVTFACLAPDAPATAVATPRAMTSDFTASVAVAAGRQIVHPTAANLPTTWRDRIDAASPIIASAWLVGVVALLGRQAIGLTQISRLRRRAVRVGDAGLVARLRGLAVRLGITRSIRLLSSSDVDCPAVVGWLRPAILWPVAAMAGLTPAQLDAILAHELAHVRRHDYLVNVLQTLVETLLFYHPGVWWLSRRIRQEREHCCDDIAAELVGDRVAYANVLSTIESRRQSLRLALSANSGSLVTRVRRLLSPAPAGRIGVGAMAALAGGAIVIIVVTALIARHDTTDSSSKEKTKSASTQLASTQPAADYAIAPGDLLRITVGDLSGAGQESVLIKRVANSGIISMPYLDTLQVAGLSETQTEARLIKAYSDQQILPHAVVSVLVVRGSDGSSVPSELFAPPGGTSAAATQAQLAQIDSSLAEVAKAMEALAKAQKPSVSQEEQPTGEYYISGAIARPGVYSLGGRKISIRQALTAAGGVAVGGTPNAGDHLFIQITRRLPQSGKTEIDTLKLTRVLDPTSEEFFLKPDDQIQVGVPPPSDQPATNP